MRTFLLKLNIKKTGPARQWVVLDHEEMYQYILIIMFLLNPTQIDLKINILSKQKRNLKHKQMRVHANQTQN